MIKHIFKQIWNQRRKNGWIILELFMVFIVLWYLVDFFSVLSITSQTPTGTEIENVHQVILSTYRKDNPKHIDYGEKSEEPGRNFMRIIERLRTHPDIESVCIGHWYYPYCPSISASGYFRDSFSVQCQIMSVSPEYFKMFNVKPHNGGDPETLGEILRQGNVSILSLEANRHLFKDGIGTGQSIFSRGDSSEVRIAGVTHEMKAYEYERPKAYIFNLFDETELYQQNEYRIWEYTDICIKTKAGVPQTDFPFRFKEEMKQQLSIGNYFLADIMPLADKRMLYFRTYEVTSTLQYRIGIGIFFLINIFLGVLGTFWLRIEKRKAEIGLRMSFGSTRVQIMQHMLAESFGLLAIASIPAMAVCINLAYLDVMPTRNMDFTAARFLFNTALTYLLLSVVIALSVWYPAKRSSSTLPAEALHYE